MLDLDLNEIPSEEGVQEASEEGVQEPSEEGVQEPVSERYVPGIPTVFHHLQK